MDSRVDITLFISREQAVTEDLGSKRRQYIDIYEKIYASWMDSSTHINFIVLDNIMADLEYLRNLVHKIDSIIDSRREALISYFGYALGH